MPRGRSARLLFVVVLCQSCLGCHLVFPYSSRSLDASPSDSPPPDGSCPAASPACWDVAARFDRTDWALYPPQIFGQAATTGVEVLALLDGTADSTYVTRTVWCDYPPAGDRDAPQTWHIERASVGQAHRLRVRGRSDADCFLGQPVCNGEIRINRQRGWTIADSAANKCGYAGDTADSNGELIDTYCTIDHAAGKVTWQAGSACITCCACPDGAQVDIEVEVSRGL